MCIKINLINCKSDTAFPFDFDQCELNINIDICAKDILIVNSAFTNSIRAHLRQASASTVQPLCDDASDSVLIENNGDI